MSEQKSKENRAAEEARIANAEEYYKARVEAEKRRNTKTSKTSKTTTKPAEYVAYDENGNAHSFRTKAAADYYARQHGTYKESESTSTNNYGETTTTKRSGGYPARPAAPAGGGGKKQGGQKKGFAKGLKL